MKRQFLMFFSAVALATLLSVLDSWIIQQQLHGGINLPRAIFQVGLGALVLYLLWGRSTPGYVLASGYMVANALLYGYELAQYYFLRNASAALPTSATVVSAVIILCAIVALVLLGLDYLDYRAEVAFKLRDDTRHQMNNAILSLVLGIAGVSCFIYFERLSKAVAVFFAERFREKYGRFGPLPKRG